MSYLFDYREFHKIFWDTRDGLDALESKLDSFLSSKVYITFGEIENLKEEVLKARQFAHIVSTAATQEQNENTQEYIKRSLDTIEKIEEKMQILLKWASFD